MEPLVFFILARYVILGVLIKINMTYGRIAHHSTLIRTLQPCPSACTCYVNYTVACNAKYLSQVPSNLPVRTRALYLNHNNIESLDAKALSRLKELEELQLQGNRIKEVSSDDFASLPRLQQIDLRNNPIVCGCNMARLVASGRNNLKPYVQLGTTKCESPREHSGNNAIDVLSQMNCRLRGRRHSQITCEAIICYNGGTCIERSPIAICSCPVGFWGPVCGFTFTSDTFDEEDEPIFELWLEKATYHSISIYWSTPLDSNVDKYLVSLYYDTDNSGHSPAVWTKSTHFSFHGLHPGLQYTICVTAYSVSREVIGEVCDIYSTQLPPSLHPFLPSPPNSSNKEPGKDDNYEDKVIKKAAIILGCIIGVCALLVVLITMVHKIRPFRRRQRSPSTAVSANPDPDVSPENGLDNTDQGREIFVVSVAAPENPSVSLADEAGASSGLQTEPSASASENSTLRSVLQALKTSSSHPGRRGTNPMVLYQPENPSPGSERRGSFEANSGNMPIFIVADGNHYPLDPSLSEVLRGAMAESNSSQPNAPPLSLLHDPPPPYSERAEEDIITYPQEAASLPRNTHQEADNQPNDTHENDSTTLVPDQNENL